MMNCFYTEVFIALYGQCKASEECKPIAQCPHERSLPRAQLQRLTFCGYLLEHVREFLMIFVMKLNG